MGKRGLAAGLILMVIATGCRELRATPALLHPLFKKAEASRVPEIEGTWVGEDDESDAPDSFEFRTTDDGQTRMILKKGDGRTTATLDLLFGRLGDDLYWDLTATPPPDEDDFYSEHRLSIHSIARIRIHDDRLEIAMLSNGWVDRAIEAGTFELPHEVLDDDLLLTASTAELQQFVLAQGSDPELFDKPGILRRAPVVR